MARYIENGSLLTLLKTFGTFSEKLASRYIQDVLSGLDYLHSKNIIHCDLKCANILTTKAGNACLSDFGVSQTFLQTMRDPSAIGSPYFMAPEVISLSGPTTASDIWSLGGFPCDCRVSLQYVYAESKN